MQHQSHFRRPHSLMCRTSSGVAGREWHLRQGPRSCLARSRVMRDRRQDYPGTSTHVMCVRGASRLRPIHSIIWWHARGRRGYVCTSKASKAPLVSWLAGTMYLRDPPPRLQGWACGGYSFGFTSNWKWAAVITSNYSCNYFTGVITADGHTSTCSSIQYVLTYYGQRTSTTVLYMTVVPALNTSPCHPSWCIGCRCCR